MPCSKVMVPQLEPVTTVDSVIEHWIDIHLYHTLAILCFFNNVKLTTEGLAQPPAATKIINCRCTQINADEMILPYFICVHPCASVVPFLYCKVRGTCNTLTFFLDYPEETNP